MQGFHLRNDFYCPIWQSHLYFPNGMNLTEVIDEQIQMAVDLLNHRPRKVTGFRTPHEVFFEVEVPATGSCTYKMNPRQQLQGEKV